MIDIHAHILPGIDDGADAIADSVEIIRELVGQGVTDIVATPHYMVETIYSSPRTKNLVLLSKLRQALKYEDVKVNLYLGNEIYITDRIAELIWDGKISTMAGGNYILVELPMSGEYSGYEDIFLELMNAGYKVVLAHPERYNSVQDDYNVLKELNEMGVLFQCNIGSILGQYDKKAKKTIQKMASEKLIFAFGTDIHRCRGEGYIDGAIKRLSKYYGERELKQIMESNPRKIIVAKS